MCPRLPSNISTGTNLEFQLEGGEKKKKESAGNCNGKTKHSQQKMKRAEGRGKKKWRGRERERGGLLAVEVVHYCRGGNGLPLILSGPAGLILIVPNIGHLQEEMARRHLGVKTSAALRHKHTRSEMKLLGGSTNTKLTSQAETGLLVRDTANPYACCTLRRDKTQRYSRLPWKQREGAGKKRRNCIVNLSLSLGLKCLDVFVDI